jgi:hypothetical protein
VDHEAWLQTTYIQLALKKKLATIYYYYHSALFSSPQYYRKSSLLLPYEWIGIRWCYKSTGNKLYYSFQMSVNLFAEKIVLLHQACYNHTSLFFLKDNCIGRTNCSARSLVNLKDPIRKTLKSFGCCWRVRFCSKLGALEKSCKYVTKMNVCDSMRNHQFFISTIVSRLCSW